MIERLLQVADESPIPTMVYNFPIVTAGQNLTSDIIGELAQHPNIVGTKLSCGDIGKLTRLATVYRPGSEQSKAHGDFATFPGKSDVFLPGLLMDSYGIIGALVNLAPKLHARVFQLYQSGEMKDAIVIQKVLSQADAAISSAGGIGGLKLAIAEHFGYGNGNVRGPLAKGNVNKIAEGMPGRWIIKCAEMERGL